ncbi:MAG: hypothetical protein AB2A00_30015 [Myxococcota bacterium]
MARRHPVRTRISVAVALLSLCLGLALARCTPVGGGGGTAQRQDASLTVTPNGGEAQKYDYDANINEIAMTPPAGGVFEASFTQGDPRLQLKVRINSEHVEEGQQVRFPLSGGLTSGDVLVTAEYQGRTYRSDFPTTTGDMTMEILNVTEDAVDFRCSMSLTLGSEAPATLNVVGFLEAHYGDTAFVEDAGFE